MKDIKITTFSLNGKNIQKNNKNNEISAKNIQFLEFLQSDDFLTRLFISKNCPGDFDYIKEFAYRNISGTELTKMALKKLFEKFSAEKSSYTSNTNIMTSFIDDIHDDSICVFAPYGIDAPYDGYKKRILAIDNGFLRKYRKIYLNCCVNPESKLKIEIIDDKHSYIKFNSFDDEQIDFVLQIINKVKITYTHSINMFMLEFTNSRLLNIFYEKEIINILDVHGDVPNEQKLNGDNLRAVLADQIEKTIVIGADAVICVSQYMKDCLVSKYKLNKDKFLILNILEDFETNFNEIKEKRINQVPAIVFAGGLQKWQCLEQMIEVIKCTKHIYNYRFYINNIEIYEEEIKEFEKETSIKAETLCFSDLKKEYMRCDYGMLLRENDPVNNVACPTKLFEYIAHGIIPIINQNTISVISELGIKCITKEQLISNTLPSLKEKEKMIESNFEIYKRIINQNKEMGLINE